MRHLINCFYCLFLLSPSVLDAQSLSFPQHPDPTMCFARAFTPIQYDTAHEVHLTYTEEEAALYPHTRKRVELRPAGGRWEYMFLPWSCCTISSDSMLLCYVSWAAEYEWIYKPKDELLGEPFYKELSILLPGLAQASSGFVGIPCDLLCMMPLYLGYEQDSDRLTETDMSEIEAVLLSLLEEYPGVVMELIYFADQEESDTVRLSERRTEQLVAYLLQHGVHPHRLLTRIHDGKAPKAPACVKDYLPATSVMFRFVGDR